MRFFQQVLASMLGALLAGVALLGLLFLGFLLSMAAVRAFFPGAPAVPTVEEGTVLTLSLNGPLVERVREEPFARLFAPVRPVSLQDIRRALARAARDDRVRVLYLEMGPLMQGGWAQLEEVRRAIVQFRDSSEKPVVVYGGPDGFLDEKAYYLASAADEIYLPPEGYFQLNGFFTVVTFYKHLLDKLGIEPQVIRAGAFKSAVEPFIRDTLSAENALQLTELLEDIDATFAERVSSALGWPPERLKALGERMVLSAREAHALGLVDSLWYADQVEARLKRLSGQEKLRRMRLSSYARTVRAPVAEDEVAVIYAEGTIVSGESPDTPDPLTGGSLMGSETIVRALEEAMERERVRAIVLRINSPGGSVTASEAIWRAVRRAAEKKPLVVSMGDVAASGGYYIAAPADTIVAEPTTITGSIGVFSLFFDVGDLLERKLGVDYDVVKTAPHADMLSGLRPLQPYERRRLEALTDSTYRRFLQVVAEGRGLSVEEVHAVAQGRVWSGRRAVQIGLVDTLGGLKEAVHLAARMAGLSTYRIRELPRLRPFFETLLRREALMRLMAPEARLRQLLQRLRQLHATPQALMPYWLEVD